MRSLLLNLDGRVLHLASHSSIETSGLPDGARLIELGDGTAVINRGGGIELLPPIQPEPVSPASRVVSKPSYEEGHVRTGYILPLGLAAVIAAGMALVALTGTLAQITRGILPNNTPPVIAAQQGSDGGLEAAVTATPTPASQLWTPTPSPTNTPTPSPTATPIPDPLGIMPFYNVQMSGKNPEHVQALMRILDYVQQRLLGQNMLGREFPVVLGNQKDYDRTNASYGLPPGEMTAPAYTFYSGPGKDGTFNSTVLIKEDRPFLEVVKSGCNEWVKPYALRKNSSALVAETSGLFGEMACNRALEELGYNFHKAAKTPNNEFYFTMLAVKNLENNPKKIFRQAVYGAWIITKESDMIAIVDERQLTADELIVLALKATSQKEPDMERKISAYSLDQDRVVRTAVRQLEPGKQWTQTDPYIIRSPAYLIPS